MIKAKDLRPGDKLILARPIIAGRGNAWPSHLGTLTHYEVLRQDNYPGNVDLWGFQAHSFPHWQVDEWIAEGRVTVERAVKQEGRAA